MLFFSNSKACSHFLFFFVIFPEFVKNGLQQLLPGFVTAKWKLAEDVSFFSNFIFAVCFTNSFIVLH